MFRGCADVCAFTSGWPNPPSPRAGRASERYAFEIENSGRCALTPPQQRRPPSPRFAGRRVKVGTTSTRPPSQRSPRCPPRLPQAAPQRLNLLQRAPLRSGTCRYTASPTAQKSAKEPERQRLADRIHERQERLATTNAAPQFTAVATATASAAHASREDLVDHRPHHRAQRERERRDEHDERARRHEARGCRAAARTRRDLRERDATTARSRPSRPAPRAGSGRRRGDR